MIGLGCLLMAAIFVYLGYHFGWKWTGFPKQRLFDWIKILVIPVAVAIGTFVLNRAAKRRDDEAQQEQRKQQENIEAQRAEEASLQTYLDYISQMLTDPNRPLRRSHLGDNLSVAARAQTLTVLARLKDGARKGSATRFLYEADLISKLYPVINLEGANLREADLRFVDLREANLQGANLQGVLLDDADLRRADLSEASLLAADVGMADLREAILQEVGFQGADLYRADLGGANLQGANLQGAFLYKAVLKGTNIEGADLRDLQDSQEVHSYLAHSNVGGIVQQLGRGYPITPTVLEYRFFRIGMRFGSRRLRKDDLNLGTMHLSQEVTQQLYAVLENSGLTQEKRERAIAMVGLLSEAERVTQEQIEEAIGDESTKLPDNLKFPASVWVMQRRA